MGHLMRSLALAEEAIARGWDVTVLGDLSPAAQDLTQHVVPSITLRPVPRDACARALADAGPVAVLHLDTYWLSEVPGTAASIISNMQDASYGVLTTDLSIDANLGAECRPPGGGGSRHYLLGVDAVPIRRQVRDRRQDRSVRPGPPRVLVVLGGTDPQRLTTRVVEALGDLLDDVALTVVCPDSQRTDVDRVVGARRGTTTVVPFLPDLPRTASEHDLVVSAAGTSVWDFACLGVPMALVCAVDNQLPGYRAVLGSGIALGLGEPPHADLEERIGALAGLLQSPGRLAALRDAGRRLVDGRGAWRIVSAWESMLATGEPVRTTAATLTARPATRDDAQRLHAWRNDEQTRLASRTPEPVPWEDHLRWLSGSLDRPDRELLVVEHAGEPVGTVRWDHHAGIGWEVSITLAPHARGRGLALPVLEAGERALATASPTRLLAVVHERNGASQRLFARAGYLPHLPPDQAGFATFARWRTA